MKNENNMVSFPADTVFPAFPPDLKHMNLDYRTQEQLPRIDLVFTQLLDTEKILSRILRTLLTVFLIFKKY